MLLKIIEKTIRENAFEQRNKKPGLNLTLAQALIGLRTTGPSMLAYAGYICYMILEGG